MPSENIASLLSTRQFSSDAPIFKLRHLKDLKSTQAIHLFPAKDLTQLIHLLQTEYRKQQEQQ